MEYFGTRSALQKIRKYKNQSQTLSLDFKESGLKSLDYQSPPALQNSLDTTSPL